MAMRQSVDSLIQLPQRRAFTALELHAAAIGTIAAIVLLFGYGFGIEPIQSVIPGFPTMKLRTAAVFMALSLSCLLSLRGARVSRTLSVMLSFATVSWILWSRINYALQPDEPLLFVLPSEGTIVCATLVGVCLLIIELAPRFASLVAVLALATATAALYRIVALILFWGAPDDTSPLNTMALHTATVIAWFMLVCVLMHPRLPFGRVLAQASLRGRVLRRAFPVAVSLPVGAAAVSLALACLFGWNEDILFALAAAISVTAGVCLIWWLARLVGQWQAESNEHASRLSRANEALEQYASAAAHDLKAPARHVMLYGELLEEALAKGDIEGARKRAKSIRESAAEMPVLIDGMLEFSRSGYSRMQPSVSLLSDLVQAGAATLEEELLAQQAKIILTRDVQLWGDPALLAAVFQNLIANSVRNRRPDRAPQIRIGAERNGDLWEITVEDNGVGFDAAFAGVAFNPLARGKHQAGEGTGIGLATCRTIVQSHGGEIRVDPGFRNGARIEFTLPARPRE